MLVDKEQTIANCLPMHQVPDMGSTAPSQMLPKAFRRLGRYSVEDKQSHSQSSIARPNHYSSSASSTLGDKCRLALFVGADDAEVPVAVTVPFVAAGCADDSEAGFAPLFLAFFAFLAVFFASLDWNLVSDERQLCVAFLPPAMPIGV